MRERRWQPLPFLDAWQLRLQSLRGPDALAAMRSHPDLELETELPMYAELEAATGAPATHPSKQTRQRRCLWVAVLR